MTGETVTVAFTLDEADKALYGLGLVDSDIRTGFRSLPAEYLEPMRGAMARLAEQVRETRYGDGPGVAGGRPAT
jgi:hypothetical protein